MITFVVNLHPGIPNMALAEPFLYPLQKDKQLHLIFPATSNLARRIEDAAMEVRKQLQRSAYTKWQVVFLAHISAQPISPFQDSISAQMMLIRKLFLNSQKQANLPTRTYIIAIDHINEDATIPAVHLSKVYKQSWQLDTKGFINDSPDFFVKPHEIKYLDSFWKNKIRTTKHEIVDAGFSALPLALQDKVNEAIENIQAEVDKLLDKEKINFYTYQITHNISYLDKELLDNIKASFEEELAKIKQKTEAYNTFSPSELFRDTIAKHLGIFALENEAFRLIRFPFTESDQHEDVLQRYLIKLSILITLLVNNETIIRSLHKEKIYTVEIKLNDKNIQRNMYTYWEYLTNTERMFDSRVKNPITVNVPMIQNADCSFAEKLEKKDTTNLPLNFLRTNGDLPRWKDWNKNIQEELGNYKLQARRKMQECINKSYKGQNNTLKVEQKNIDYLVEDLGRKKNTLKEKIEHGFLSNTNIDDWETFQKKQEQALIPKLFSRPTRNEIILLVSICIIVLILPFTNSELANQLIYPVVYYTSVILIAIVLCLLTLYKARKKYQEDINKIVNDSRLESVSMRDKINAEFERQKAYLESLCKLSIVRKDYEAALIGKKEKNDQTLLLDYHKRKLSEHKGMADRILRIFKANTNNLNSHYNEEHLPETEIELPICENDIYTPNTFIGHKEGDGREVGKIEGINYIINSDLGHLVSNIVFKQDSIYNQSHPYK